MKALTTAAFRGIDGPFAVFSLDYDVEIRVGLIEADIGRVTLRRGGKYRLDRGWSVAPGGLEPPFSGRLRDDLTGFSCPSFDITQGEGIVSISGAAMRAEVRLSPFGICWFRTDEAQPFMGDRSTQAYFLSRRTGALSHFMARDAAERHFGLGDKSGPLDKTGRRFRIDAVDPCGFDAETSDPLYKMIPFFIVDGPAGPHGVYYDNLATASVDFGATLDNYHGLFRSYQADDGDLDYYVLGGGRVPDIVSRFSWLTGGQAFPPRWSLGFAMTSMAIADAKDADAQIRAFAGKCHETGIPCRSFHFGSGYTMHDGKRYAFTWNREKFPHPEATLRALHEAGMHTVANLKPCLLDDHPRLGELAAAGLVTDAETGKPSLAQFWDGLGYHLDFTSPEGREWWARGMRDTLLEPGFDTVWSDNNEFEIWDEDALCAGDGRAFPQSLARPAQPLLMTKLTFETQKAHAPHRRPYTVTRGGAAGIWRYGQTWSGDNATAWKTLRFNLAQGLNMSMSGMFNIGHDAGGFHGPSPGPELLCRFVEFCALWPRFVMNSWNEDGITTLPWMHPEVLAPIRAAMMLRERLMPYVYTCMWRASVRNEPVIRPLFYDFPQDGAVRTLDDAFMLGPDCLVAPVLEEGAVTRALTLPQNPGGWFDLHDGRHHECGEVTIAAPLGRLPVFVRAGAMLPVAAGEILVFGLPEHATAELYEDDGETPDWQNGGGLHIRFDARRAGDTLTVSARAEGRFNPAYEAIMLRMIGGARLAIGTADGVRLRLAEG